MKTKRDAAQKDKHAAFFCTAAAERAYLLQICSRFPNDSDALTFRADPPILQKCESADMRWINKARLSEHICLARVTDCEGMGATLEVFARSAAQLQKAAKSGQQKVNISGKYLINGKPSRWRMHHDHINMACKSRAPTLRGAEVHVVDVPADPQAHAFRPSNIAQSERLVWRCRAHVPPAQ